MCSSVVQRSVRRAKAAFAEAAQRPLQGVVGVVVDREDVAVGGLLERDVHAMTCALAPLNVMCWREGFPNWRPIWRGYLTRGIRAGCGTRWGRCWLRRSRRR
jgi:hypothetical protein